MIEGDEPGVLRLDAGSWTVLIRDELTYTPNSADNPRRYDREIVLGQELGRAAGVEVYHDGRRVRSVALITFPAMPPADEARALVRGDLLILALGQDVHAFGIPGLEPRWETEADPACVFALHAFVGSDDLIVRGELSISRLGLDGAIRWSGGGRDIFTGDFAIGEDDVMTTDWNDDVYRFRLADGAVIESPSRR
ncbi:hypothetical protein [Longimicrobium terrae]|uniref:Uncharacterized protein n=1 Tax=Longimicrobium terrae TaxID=1639882 RepID=A0A841GMN6_9BACT|nr:hypothetical protein [Longimicrobium terrae]MBB4635493.1 hypothetical protein [Longimicrobium terrae]MBB6069887.1 hypothetical protein [Longimicrobium terrae]NNC32802.1 hypothetical protein [Longimicrobium terrae]